MNIKDYLKRQGVEAAEITNVKLAAAAGVSESTIKRELARNEEMDLDYIVAIVDHFEMSRTKTLKELGVLELDDLQATVGESPTLESASQVEMLRELLTRAEESDPNVVEVTEFPALSDDSESTDDLDASIETISGQLDSGSDRLSDRLRKERKSS